MALAWDAEVGVDGLGRLRRRRALGGRVGAPEEELLELRARSLRSSFSAKSFSASSAPLSKASRVSRSRS